MGSGDPVEQGAGCRVSGQVRIMLTYLFNVRNTSSQRKRYHISLPVWGSPLFFRLRKITDSFPGKSTNKHQLINSREYLINMVTLHDFYSNKSHFRGEKHHNILFDVI